MRLYEVRSEDGEKLFSSPDPAEAVRYWAALTDREFPEEFLGESARGVRWEKILDEGYAEDGRRLLLVRSSVLEYETPLPFLEGKEFTGLEASSGPEGAEGKEVVLRFAEGDLRIFFGEGARGEFHLPPTLPHGERVESAVLRFYEEDRASQRGWGEVVLETRGGRFSLTFESDALEDYDNPMPRWEFRERERESEAEARHDYEVG